MFLPRCGSGFQISLDPDPVCPERLDPDPIFPERLDPDPVNMRLDPKPWLVVYEPESYLDQSYMIKTNLKSAFIRTTAMVEKMDQSEVSEFKRFIIKVNKSDRCESSCKGASKL